MPHRTLTAGGRVWRVAPSGFVTPYISDEFSLVFTTGGAKDRETRVVRYSPWGTRSREESLASLTDDDLAALLAQSQPGALSPEAHYSR